MAEKQISRRGFLGGSAVALGAGLMGGAALAADKLPPARTILSYDERMEYRRLGKTGLYVSAISLGGHWKRCPFRGEAFQKNRTDIVAKCLDSGINYVDACCHAEVLTYAKALHTLKKRDQMFFGFSDCGREVRSKQYRTKRALLEVLDDLMKKASLDYVDFWRITCHEPGGLHTYNTACEIAAAGEQAIRDGKIRFFGISSHDRRWLEFMVREFPVVSAILTPYTAKSKEKPQGSFFDTVREQDVGVFGIKPFASNSIFKGKSTPDDPHREEDDKRARMALRYVLCCDAITAPIPGLIYPHHVDNCLLAIEERRKHDLAANPAILRDREFAAMSDRMFDRLPPHYQWLRDWEWV
ncbi:MAG: aldo/keto reductase [Candidatus Brocadiia bacterium]